jgi:hypothetical protein
MCGRIIEGRRMEHVARMEAKRNAYKMLFVKLDGKKLERP